MAKDIKGVNEYESLWDSFKKIPETLTSLANGIGTMANQNKLFDTDEWSKIWTEATQEEEMPKPKPKKASASIEQIEGGAEESSKQNPLDTFTALQDALKKNFENLFQKNGEEEAAAPAGGKPVVAAAAAPPAPAPAPAAAPEHIWETVTKVIDSSSWFNSSTSESTSTTPIQRNSSYPLESSTIPTQPTLSDNSKSQTLQSPNPPTTPPIQSKQEKIKRDLEAKINEGVPTGEGTTEKEILEHKEKQLSTIFFELKYQRIDEILHVQDTSAKEKINKVKKFQNQFKLDLPINSNDALEKALNHLSSDIATENLNYDSTALSSKKFTPTSYTVNELQNHTIHSKYYLDGILGVDEIDAEKRIEAAKLFVKQLELVSEPDNSNMANVHKQFVQYQADESSGDSKKIVAEGVEFAKSISRDSTTSFLGTDGKVSNPSHFHNSVVKHEVDQRDLVIRKFTEQLSGLSSVLKSEAIINKAKTNEIFEKTKITYTIDPETRKITFKDPNPPVVAGGAGAAAGAGGGATAGGAGGATADVAPANPLTDISFVGLSNEDILRRSLVLKYVTEGIMEAEGNDADKEKAINFLIHEMKITTQTQFAHQNASYGNHIKINTEFSNSQEENQKINNLKNIGAELLRRVASEPTETVLMSDPVMERIYKDTRLSLKTPIIDDNSMGIITKRGNEDIRKYIKAVQEFQEKEIKEILGKTTGTNAEKKQQIEAILKLSLTYDDHSSQLKIKTTRGNLDKIEILKAAAKDDNTLIREESRLMQSYFSNLYKGALATENVDDDQKILGLKAINAINSVANDDRNFLNFKKIKDQSAKDNAIASGKAITQAVKAESFDEKGEVAKKFSWQDTGEIDQTKLKTLYAKYLEKEKEKEKEKAEEEAKKKAIKPRGCLTSWCTFFSCFRPEKPKETELSEDEEKKKSDLLKLVSLKPDAKTKKIEEPDGGTKNKIFYRITKETMDNILNSNAQDKLKLLKELMDLRKNSVNIFIDDFTRNPDLSVSALTKYSNISSQYSTNYLQKFCKAILDSKEGGIGDDKKLKALKSFISEQKDVNLQNINSEIANTITSDAAIKDKAKTFLVAVSKSKEGEETVYSDEKIKVKMKESKTDASTSTPAARPTPAAAVAAAAPAPAGPASAAAAATAPAADPAAADPAPAPAPRNTAPAAATDFKSRSGTGYGGGQSAM